MTHVTSVTEIARNYLSAGSKRKEEKFRSSRPRDSLLCDMCVCCCCSTTVNPKGILTAATVDFWPVTFLTDTKSRYISFVNITRIFFMFASR